MHLNAVKRIGTEATLRYLDVIYRTTRISRQKVHGLSTNSVGETEQLNMVGELGLGLTEPSFPFALILQGQTRLGL
jgi:hypothetical protein